MDEDPRVQVCIPLISTRKHAAAAWRAICQSNCLARAVTIAQVDLFPRNPAVASHWSTKEFARVFNACSGLRALAISYKGGLKESDLIVLQFLQALRATGPGRVKHLVLKWTRRSRGGSSWGDDLRAEVSWQFPQLRTLAMPAVLQSPKISLWGDENTSTSIESGRVPSFRRSPSSVLQRAISNRSNHAELVWYSDNPISIGWLEMLPTFISNSSHLSLALNFYTTDEGIPGAEFFFALGAMSVPRIHALHLRLFSSTSRSDNQPFVADGLARSLSGCLRLLTSLRILTINWTFWCLANSTDIISALAPMNRIREIRFELPSDLIASPELVHAVEFPRFAVWKVQAMRSVRIVRFLVDPKVRVDKGSRAEAIRKRLARSFKPRRVQVSVGTFDN